MENEKKDPLEDPIPDGEAMEAEFDAFDEAAEEEAFYGAFAGLDQIDNEIEKEKEDARSSGRGQSVFWGFALIAVGAILILQRTGLMGPNFNWWAMFIFIPAIGALSTAWHIFTKKRRITGGVRSSFGSFVVLGTLATILLLGLNWRIWWPLMVIAPGFSVFLGGFVDRKSKASPAEKWFVRSGCWVGLSMMALGAVFLAQNLGIYQLRELTGLRHWWALFLLLPGITFLLHAILAVIMTHRFPFGAVLMIFGGISALSVALVALLALDWALIPAVIAVGSGIMIIIGEFLRKAIQPKQVSSATIERKEATGYQK